MRITGLHVGGFGLLEGLEVDGVGPGITVVCGPNEAGKSTLHTFIVRTLFGHPRTNDARGRSRHEPVRGGRHGGVIRAADGTGGAWEIHRYTTGSPVLRILAPDGAESTSDDALTDLLGRGMDEARYEQVFAINLDALSGRGALDGSALDELLLDAATVGAGRSMRQAIAALEKRRDALWKPRSQKPPLNAELAARRKAEQRLRDAQEAAGAYRKAQDELARIGADLETVRAEQVEVRDRAKRHEHLLAAWDTWEDLLDARRRLTEAGDVVVPDGLADEVATLMADRHAAADAAATRRAQASEHEDAAAAVVVDDRLAEVAQRVTDHAAGLGLQADRRTRLERARERAHTTAATAEEAVAMLPGTWDAPRVRATPADPTILPAVQTAVEQLQSERRELETAEQAVDEVTDRLSDAQEKATRLAAAVGERPTGDLPARRAAAAALRGDLSDLASQEARATTTGTGSRWPAHVGAVAALVLVGIGAVAIVTGSTFLGAGAIAAAVLVGIAVAGMVRSTTGGAGTGSGTEARDTSDIRAQITATARVLGLSPPIHRSDVETADQTTGQLELAQRAWQDRQDKAEQAAAEVTTAATAVTKAEDRRDGHADGVKTAEAAWAVARDRAGLDTEVAPAAAAVLLTAIAEARRALAAADEAVRTRNGLADEVAGFDAVTEELCAAAGRDAGDAPDAALRRLAEDCAADATARAEREHATEKAQEARRKAADENHQVDRLDAELATAYARIGVGDGEAFATAVTVDDARRTAEADRDRADRLLRRHLGDDAAAADLRQELETGRVTAWTDELTELKVRATELDDTRDQLVSEQTTAARNVEELGEDDAVATAALAVETHNARCAELAEEWATTDLAAGLLRTTLQRFEDAHQPSVLTDAGILLAQATLGRWTDVRRIDDELYVAANGDPVPVSVLSRGAAEQLYLCLRLALAEELNASGARLPLLIDDLMANADPERADGLARILADVASRQQVVVFTCNPSTADRIMAADASAGVLAMQAGGAGAEWRIAASG